MATIPTAEEDLPQPIVNPSSPVEVIDKGDERAFKAPAEATEQLGTSVAALGATLQEKQNQTDEYEARKQFVDFDLQQQQSLQDMQRAAPENPVGFTQQWQQNYDQNAKAFLKNIPESQKPQYDALLTQRGATYQTQAQSFQQGAQDQYQVNDLGRQTQGLATSITQPNPDGTPPDAPTIDQRLTGNLARGAFLIDGTNLPFETKAKLKTSLASQLAETALRGRIASLGQPGNNDTPQSIIKTIQSAPAPGPLGATSNLTTDDAGLDFIRKNENFAPVAQPDGSKGYSAGYGTYGVAPGTRMSREQAETAMESEVGGIEKDMAAKIKAPLTQSQHNALVDLFYNISRDKDGRLDQVASMINSGQMDKVPAFISQFRVSSDGVPMPGLAARRQKEVALWNDKGSPLIESPDPDATDAQGPPPGLVTPGTLDASKQPVVKSPDGSVVAGGAIATPTPDGKTALIPTVDDNGQVMSNQQAIDAYKEHGQHLGIFDNEQNADAYALKLHNDQIAGVQANQPLSPYRFLTPRQRSTLVNVTRLAGRSTAMDSVKNAAAQIRNTGNETPDANGQTALDKAQGILTQTELQGARDQIHEADLYHATVSPLYDMSVDAGRDHIAEMSPHVGAPDYFLADRVAKEANRIVNQIDVARKKDPALAVKDAPEVQQAWAGINALRQAPDGTDPSKTVDVAGLTSPQKANQMLIDARIAAQRRLGIDESNIMPVTKDEASALFKGQSLSKLSDIELPKALRDARDLAELKYGPYAKQVFEKALGAVSKGDKISQAGAPIIRKMLDGEPLEASDYQASNALANAAASDRLFDPNAMGSAGPMLSIPQDVGGFKPQSPTVPGGWMSSPTTPADGAFNTAKQATPFNPAVIAGSKNVATPAAVKYLKANPSSWQKFEQLYGPGSAAAALRQ